MVEHTASGWRWLALEGLCQSREENESWQSWEPAGQEEAGCVGDWMLETGPWGSAGISTPVWSLLYLIDTAPHPHPLTTEGCWLNLILCFWEGR